jgi:hypothetical protein
VSLLDALKELGPCPEGERLIVEELSTPRLQPACLVCGTTECLFENENGIIVCWNHLPPAPKQDGR